MSGWCIDKNIRPATPLQQLPIISRLLYRRQYYWVKTELQPSRKRCRPMVLEPKILLPSTSRTKLCLATRMVITITMIKYIIVGLCLQATQLPQKEENLCSMTTKLMPWLYQHLQASSFKRNNRVIITSSRLHLSIYQIEVVLSLLQTKCSSISHKRYCLNKILNSK